MPSRTTALRVALLGAIVWALLGAAGCYYRYPHKAKKKASSCPYRKPAKKKR